MSRKSRERREKPWSWLKPPTILPDMPQKGEPLPEKAPPAKLREQPVRKPEPPKEAAPRLFREQSFQKTGHTKVPGCGAGNPDCFIWWGLTEKDEICVTECLLDDSCWDFTQLGDESRQWQCFGQVVIRIPAEIEGYPVTELDGIFMKYHSQNYAIESVELHLPAGMKRVHSHFRVVKVRHYDYIIPGMGFDEDAWDNYLYYKDVDYGWTYTHTSQETLPFTICGAPGSYAEKLAREHGLEFCKEK